MGDTNDSIKPERIVFVTVGTTCFDALVRVVDNLEVKQELFNKGYTRLLIQMGRGSYIPTKSSGEDRCLAVDYFTFSSSIADNLRSASLVISHAGNSHSSDSYVGDRTTKKVHEASEYVKRCMGGGEDNALIFCGWGTTATIKQLQEVMGIAIPSTMRERVLQI